MTVNSKLPEFDNSYNINPIFFIILFIPDNRSGNTAPANDDYVQLQLTQSNWV